MINMPCSKLPAAESLERESVRSLYEQAADRLRAHFMGMRPGERVPTEAELPRFFCFGGLKLLRQEGQNGPVEPVMEAGADVLPASARAVGKALTRCGLTAYQWCSLAAVLCFITLVLRRFDVGLTAFAAGMTLQIIFRTNGKQAIAKLPWALL